MKRIPLSTQKSFFCFPGIWWRIIMIYFVLFNKCIFLWNDVNVKYFSPENNNNMKKQYILDGKEKRKRPCFFRLFKGLLTCLYYTTFEIVPFERAIRLAQLTMSFSNRRICIHTYINLEHDFVFCTTLKKNVCPVVPRFFDVSGRQQSNVRRLRIC